jgi:hypothetical protein
MEVLQRVGGLVEGREFHKYIAVKNGWQQDCLKQFLNLLLHFGDWVVGGGGAVDGLALLVDDELGEVPFDGVHQKAGLFILQVLP